MDRAALPALLGFLMTAPPILDHTRYVTPDGSGDFPTIQAAIHASIDGDEIRLLDGVFAGEGNVDLAFTGKAITLASESGDPATCVIDCEDEARAALLQAGEGPATVLRVITDNTTTAHGGGVYCDSASPTLTHCVLRGNTGNRGGAIHGREGTALTLESCTLYGDASTFGGVVGCYSTTLVMDRTILANRATGGAVICLAAGDVLTLSCCNVFGNAGGDWMDCLAGLADQDGDFSADPLFCDPDAGDFTLQADSPCAPPGVTGGGLVGALPVSCGPVSVESRRWGSIKASNRNREDRR